jgi:hypothetical protein
MAITIVTPASTKALTTTARILTETGEAGVTAQAILVASAMVVARLGYELAKETVIETLQGSDRSIIVLSRRPVTAISLVKQYGATITTEAVIENSATGFLFRYGGWPSSSYYAPGVSPYPSPIYGELPFSFSYTGGFFLPSFAGSPAGTDVLLPVWAEAAAQQLALQVNKGAAGAITEEKVGGEYSAKYATSEAAGGAVPMLSSMAEALLAPHAMVTL